MEQVRKVRRLTADLEAYHAELLQRIHRKEEELQTILHEHMCGAAAPKRDEARRTTVSFAEPSSTRPDTTSTVTHNRQSSIAHALRSIEVNNAADGTDKKETHAWPTHFCGVEAFGAADASSLGATDSVTLPLTSEQRRWRAAQTPPSTAPRGDEPTRAHNDENVPPSPRGTVVDSMQLSPIARLQSCGDRSLCMAALSPSARASSGPVMMPANGTTAPQTRKTEGRHVRFSNESPLVATASPGYPCRTQASTNAAQPLASPRTSAQLYLSCLQNLRCSLQAGLQCRSSAPTTDSSPPSPPPSTGVTAALREGSRGDGAVARRSPSVTCATSDGAPNASRHTPSPILLRRPRTALRRNTNDTSAVSARSTPVELPSVMCELAADESAVHLARHATHSLAAGAPLRYNKKHARHSTAAALSQASTAGCAVTTRTTSQKEATAFCPSTTFQQRGYTSSIVLACGPTQYFD